MYKTPKNGTAEESVDAEKGFRVAFEAAWQAYISGTIPIGACVLNEQEEVVAIGKNQIHCEADGNNLIAMHQLAHAEANVILRKNIYFI
ncbi:hypothetical protein [Anaerotaenia torta]|uniref:hypothetical protein n=1 Tax=Anaerotaenia torta TaxID=433293 RepID=UPI003D1B5A62